MMTQPKIVDIAPRTLIGKRIQTTLAENKTFELWGTFKPKIKDFDFKKDVGFYSLQEYGPDLDFSTFTPQTSFEKWAAVEVRDYTEIPEGLESYTLVGGKYAIFIHKGPASAFPKTAGYIFGQWMPSSPYELDDRAHFELFNGKYQPNDPEAVEEVWIPIKSKTNVSHDQ